MHSWRLPAAATAVAFGPFCPDFVCQLTEGRVRVAEHKGEHLRAVPKEIEKRQMGAVWAGRSAGQAVCELVHKQARGLSMAQQIEASLDSPARPASSSPCRGGRPLCASFSGAGYRMP